MIHVKGSVQAKALREALDRAQTPNIDIAETRGGILIVSALNETGKTERAFYCHLDSSTPAEVTADRETIASLTRENWAKDYDKLTALEGQLREFDAWLSFRSEFSEVLTAFRKAFRQTTKAVREAPTASEGMEREALEKLKGIVTVLSDAGLNDEEIEILFNAAQEA